MAFKQTLKPIVYFDVDEAVEWYEKQSKGLGEKFMNQVDIALIKIKENPYNYIEYYKHVRRILLDTFPYKIFYTISQDEIIVLGIYHSKRSKAFIRKKLK